MGVACGDLDGDGRPDLAVTNFYGESTTLYRNLGGGLFTDRTAAVGLAAPTRSLLGFGVAFLDADNDGRLDLAPANGHVNDFRPARPLRDARPALPGRPGRAADRRLRPRRARLAGPARRPGPGRRRPGQRRPARRADRLAGRAPGLPPQPDRRRPLPDAPARGDRLEPRRRRRRRPGHGRGTDAGSAWRLSGGSYLSSSDGRLHFGLGPRTGASPLASPSRSGGRAGTSTDIRS